MIPLDPVKLRAELGQSVLLVGATGMLGRAMRSLLAACGVECQAPSPEELDLAGGPTLARFESVRWNAIINCAAWTDVDGAEQNEAGATAVNAGGTAALARAVKASGGLLVTFSTDYVFDGSATSPYPLHAKRSPVNAYGRSKAAAEEALEQSGARFLNVRTSWLYAPWAKNFVRTIAKAAREKPVLRVVHDQRGRPTSAEHLANCALSLAARGATGHRHATDGGECSWFEFATAIAAATNPACRVEPCTTAEFPRPAKRPAYSVLDLSQTESALGPMPDWRNNLADVLRRLEP